MKQARLVLHSRAVPACACPGLEFTVYPHSFRRGAALPFLALAAATLLCGPPSVAQVSGGTIERIEVRGLKRMTVDAFVFASGLKTGQAYDPQEVRHAFRRLWDRRLFSDLKAEVETGPSGVQVIFTARERPIVVSIDYDQVRAITKSNIEDRLKERSVNLAVGKPLDRRLAHRAEDTIRDLLGEKGYLDATVKVSIDVVSEGSAGLRFKIRQGPRTRIKKIDFVGNEIISDRKLRGAMKLTREHSIFTAISSKDIYFPMKYDQDIEKVRELYQNAGYLDVDIKPPQVEIRSVKRSRKEPAAVPESPAGVPSPGPEATRGGTGSSAEAAEEAVAVPPGPEGETERQRKKREEAEEKRRKKEEKKAEKADRKWVYLTVRVKEGAQYLLGEISSTGNTVFSDKEVRERIPLAKGAILNRSLLDTGVDILRASYGEKGYIYASVGRSLEKKEGNIADVTLEIREDRPYYVDRIEFEGNTTTRDEVLRREVRLNEGDLLDKRKLNLSVYKINQLGFIAPLEEPAIEPIPGTDRARIRIRTEEKGRNEIQVGGGFSGQEGFFFAGSYSTRNFLGRGETVSLSLQVGGSMNLYALSFAEPYFLGKPTTLGFNVFRREVEYARDETREGSGGSVLLGRQFRDFGSAQVVYSFEKVRYTDPALNVSGQEYSYTTDTRVGSLTPSIAYNRVNNPFRPSRGHAALVSLMVAGSYLGGDNSFYKPYSRATQYVPLTRRTFLGLHEEAAVIIPYGSETLYSGQILGVPRFERFYMGGDYLGPRGFETRSISPLRYVSSDGTAIARSVSDIITYAGRDVFGQKIEKSCREEFDFTPEDGRCSNGLSQVFIGGRAYFLTQFEYAIEAGGPFVLAFFIDVGNALAEDDPFGLSGARVSAGVEARVFVPVFQAPLRFIYAQAVRKASYDKTTGFQFSIGSSF